MGINFLRIFFLETYAMLYQFKYKIITALLKLIDLSPCPAYESVSFLPVSLSLPVIISEPRGLLVLLLDTELFGTYVCCQTHFLPEQDRPCLGHQFQTLTPAEFSWPGGVGKGRCSIPFSNWPQSGLHQSIWNVLIILNPKDQQQRT